jgi:bifunctional UDP-N-acetylglucosamine pyrophosphorylase/glucosamine-1-phosphate N-acetyltransferase/UDP-N-acetylglucosamine pyrophosphorylase
MQATSIILAAGKGTRMKSDLPKVLHKVCGRPMLQYVLDACRGAGCDRQICVVGHKQQLVRDELADQDDVVFVEQSPQLGTGHAVMVCEDELADLDGPVLVVAGDGPLVTAKTLRAILDEHIARDADCTLATCILQTPGAYGRIVRDDAGELLGIVEYLDADEAQRAIHEVNVSLYCFDAAALRGALGRLTNDNAKGEYYLTDALQLIRDAGGTLAAVPAVPPEEVVSINTLEELTTVEEMMQARRAEGGGA